MTISRTYTRFAIVDGTEGQSGLYGDAILQHLLKQTTVVEVRHIRTNSEPPTKGSILVDPSEHNSLVESLKGIDVVLTFPDGWEVLIGELQRQVAAAAKEAGVSLFVPFEWGHPKGFLDYDPAVIREAKKTRDYLEKIQLPYLVFQTGPAADVVLPGLLFLEDEGRSAKVTGSGETKISWLASQDAAHFAATVLTSELPVKLQGYGVIPIPGDDLTIHEVLTLVSKKQDYFVKPSYVSVEDAKKAAGNDPQPHTFLSWLMVVWDLGRAKVDEAVLQIPNYHPTPIEKLLESNLIKT